MSSQDRLVWRNSSYSGTNSGQCVEVANRRSTDAIWL
ncbi:DUF397 domain-containing protein [Nocardia sp. NPDC052278]